MKSDGMELSSLLRQEGSVSRKKQLEYVWKLSIPGMLAQVSSIIMQYIDAAMVGNLGKYASAAIGLVASSTWLMGGVTHACVMGFTVQVAQSVGAGNQSKARSILCQSIVCCSIFAVIFGAIGAALSFFLPQWLGAEQAIHKMATQYFFVFALSLPFNMIVMLMGGMLQCSGNMKVPSILNAAMCFMDVAFNYLFIYIFNLGVMGAALGTTCATIVTALLMTYFTCSRSPVLNLKTQRDWHVKSESLRQALKISLPMAFESAALCGAQVASTRVVAPLGSIAIAANSFAVTAESLCYMPGYGVQEASTTLVGQSIGAGRKDYARHFAWMTIIIGMTVMAVMGVLMYFLCPFVFKFLTPDLDVQNLGIKVLRLELIAEPLFGASIVATGALRGAGDTLIPSIMNLISMWGVRITLAVILAPVYGLSGVWIAMACELCFRGIILLVRLASGRWLKRAASQVAAKD